MPRGYSVRNLRYMRRFAEMFDENENLQEPLADLTWYHLQSLMDKFSDKNTLLWYANKALENGWSRNILLHQIETKLYERQALSGKATNFDHALPSPQSELARDTLKNPYVFDFIEIRDDIIEREIENELVLSPYCAGNFCRRRPKNKHKEQSLYWNRLKIILHFFECMERGLEPVSCLYLGSVGRFVEKA